MVAVVRVERPAVHGAQQAPSRVDARGIPVDEREDAGRRRGSRHVARVDDDGHSAESGIPTGPSTRRRRPGTQATRRRTRPAGAGEQQPDSPALFPLDLEDRSCASPDRSPRSHLQLCRECRQKKAREEGCLQRRNSGNITAVRGSPPSTHALPCRYPQVPPHGSFHKPLSPRGCPKPGRPHDLSGCPGSGRPPAVRAARSETGRGRGAAPGPRLSPRGVRHRRRWPLPHADAAPGAAARGAA